MSLGDLGWYLDLRNPQGAFASPQRDAYNKRREGENKLEAARKERLRLDQEITAIRERLGLEKESALGVAEISGNTKDRDARRQADTNMKNAQIYTGTVLPATTQSTIAIEDNTFKNKGNLLTTAGGLSKDILQNEITLKTGAAKDFFPLVTDQITKIQAAPVDLARSAIASQEMMAREDRALVEKLWHLQNPKRGFGQQLLSAAPGLAAAALLAFS